MFVQLFHNRLLLIIYVIVHYSDTEMYSRYFDPVNNNHLASQ
jgi:hypothetical protein